MLVPRDLCGVRSDAKSGTDRVVKEYQAEDSVPGGRIGFQSEGIGRVFVEIHAPWAELVEVGEHGGAAGAALEPYEEGDFGNGGCEVPSFVESVENGRAAGGVDREVA